MAALIRVVRPRPRAEFDVEVLKILMIFSGSGLLLSLLSAIDGMDRGLQAMF
jgi:hypothetical protein